MHEQHFQFRNRPFNSLPVVEDFFPATSHRQAYDMARMCVTRSSGPVVLIGSVGIGKTLLLQMIGESLREQYNVVHVEGSQFQTRSDFLQSLLFELDLPYSGMGEGELRLTLLGRLKKSQSVGDGLLLLIDEADRLSVEIVDEVRMIASQVRGGKSVVNVVLAGSPRLEETLTDPRLASFNQRIATRCYLQNFSKAESSAYIKERIENAGRRQEDIFDTAAVGEICRFSDGCPRLLNQLCDQSLILAAGQQIQTVTQGVVQAAWAEMQNLPMDSVRGPSTSEQCAGTDSPQDIVEFGQLLEEGDDFGGSAEYSPACTDEVANKIASTDLLPNSKNLGTEQSASSEERETGDLFLSASSNRTGVAFDVLGVDPFAPVPSPAAGSDPDRLETSQENPARDEANQFHQPPHSFRSEESDRRQNDDDRRFEDGTTVANRIESLQQEQQELLDQAGRTPQTSGMGHWARGADAVQAAFSSLGDLSDAEDEVEVTENFTVPPVAEVVTPHGDFESVFQDPSVQQDPNSIQDFQSPGERTVDPMRWEPSELPDATQTYTDLPLAEGNHGLMPVLPPSEHDSDFDPQQPFELDSVSASPGAIDQTQQTEGSAPQESHGRQAIEPVSDRTEDGLEIPLHPAMTANDPFGDSFEEEELLQDAYTPFVIQQNQSSLSVTSSQLARLQPIDEASPSTSPHDGVGPTLAVDDAMTASPLTPENSVDDEEGPGLTNDIAPDSFTTQEESVVRETKLQREPDSAYPLPEAQSFDTPTAAPIMDDTAPAVSEIDEELAAFTSEFDELIDMGAGSEEIHGASLLDLNDLVAHLPEDVGTYEYDPPHNIGENIELPVGNESVHPGGSGTPVSHETVGGQDTYSADSDQDLAGDEEAIGHDGIVPMSAPTSTGIYATGVQNAGLHSSESENEDDDQSSQILREIFTQQKIIRDDRQSRIEAGDGSYIGLRPGSEPAQSSETTPAVEYPIDQHPEYQQQGRDPWQADDRDILKVNESNQIESPQAKEEPTSSIFPQIGTSTGSAERVDYQQLFDRLRNLPRE